VYTNWSIFFKAHRLALKQRPLRFKRLLLIAFFTALFLFTRTLLVAARFLDHILFPGFRKTPVKAPIFIIAPPRSGTTFLQRLLCCDRRNFTCVKFYQTIIPSVLLIRLAQSVASIDRKIGRPFARLGRLLERTFFGGWEGLHDMRFSQPEEDGGLLVYTLVTESIYMLFPFIDEIPEAGFPDMLPPDHRRRLMRYYRSCLQRIMYVSKCGPTLLLKNTQMCGGIKALLEEFPDSRIITLMRHPYQSLPSHVSLFHKVWCKHSPEIAKDSPQSEAYARLAARWYKHLTEELDRLERHRYIRIMYKDLVQSPAQTVMRIYRHFDIPMSEETAERLRLEEEKARGYKSKHRYSLREYGLDEAWVQKLLGDLLERFFPEEAAVEGRSSANTA